MVHLEGEPTQTRQTRTPEKEHEIQARKVIAHFHCCLWFFFKRCCSVTQSHATPWTAARQASLFITSSRSLLRLISTESVMPFNHLILCRPLLLPSIFPSIRVFPNESVLCIRWPKYWSFTFSISPSNEYSRLVSLKIDWFDLLVAQGSSRVFSSPNV